MILSAVSLWKKFELTTPLNAREKSSSFDEEAGIRLSSVTYSGHAAEDGIVRIFARFARPEGSGKLPAILLLNDGDAAGDDELLYYFADKGYAVLMPDYAGESEKNPDAPHTVYPDALSYANYVNRGGFDELKDEADKSCWFEWIYVALYSIEYLKSRGDVTSIGVVGIRVGGEIAWKTMLSPDLKCGVAINAAGWRAYRNVGKFADNAENNMSDERHRYIAGIESQSYAPFVKCPVLMLCALHDDGFDYDRAYDTYSRIGCGEGSAIAYSADSGSCIGPKGLEDMSLFLERHLKGREIYVPRPLNVSLKYEDGALIADVECDEEGILEEAGVSYAESLIRTKSTSREWQRVYKTDGKTVKNGKFSCRITPFEGADSAYVYAYATYINGFKVASKIAAKKFPSPDKNAVKSRVVYSGEGVDCFSVSAYEDYSASGIFLEREAVPKLVEGYGGIKGAYSPGGIKTYKISSPRCVASEGALLEFDIYAKKTASVRVSVDIVTENGALERYGCAVSVKGGGKWKRNVLSAADFKSETTGAPLSDFSDGQSLSFDCGDESVIYAVTNILWL